MRVKKTCWLSWNSSQHLVSISLSSSATGSLQPVISSFLPSSKETNPSSSMSATSYSSLVTTGAQAVPPVEKMSSTFLPVKMSTPVTWIFAAPCFPGLETAVSLTLHGKPFSMQQAPFLMDPPWTGTQSEDPDSVFWNCQNSSYSTPAILQTNFYLNYLNSLLIYR